MEWKRPENIPFPQVWRRFQGNKIIDGNKREYWVQDITEEYIEPVVRYMCTEFLKDEPISKYSFATDDPLTVRIMEQLWRQLLQQKLGLICLTKDKSGVVHIAGMNCTGRASKHDPQEDTHDKPEKYRRIIELVYFISKSKNCFEDFGLDSYLTAMGLYVPVSFRGEGIGLELLKAREALCKGVGIKASLTVFTSVISQKLAVRAGFQDYVEFSYEELEKINPLFSFPGITKFTKSIKFMVILY